VHIFIGDIDHSALAHYLSGLSIAGVPKAVGGVKCGERVRWVYEGSHTTGRVYLWRSTLPVVLTPPAGGPWTTNTVAERERAQLAVFTEGSR